MEGKKLVKKLDGIITILNTLKRNVKKEGERKEVGESSNFYLFRSTGHTLFVFLFVFCILYFFLNLRWKDLTLHFLIKSDIKLRYEITFTFAF